MKQNVAPMGFTLMRAVKADVNSVVVIYNVLSRHAEFLAPPKLTPDSEAICPATERLSRTTGQWDGSCPMQCFPQPVTTHSQRIRGKARFFFSKDDITSKNHNPAHTILLSNTLQKCVIS